MIREGTMFVSSVLEMLKSPREADKKNIGNHPQPTPVREEQGTWNAKNAEDSRRPEGRFQHRGIRRQNFPPK